MLSPKACTATSTMSDRTLAEWIAELRFSLRASDYRNPLRHISGSSSKPPASRFRLEVVEIFSTSTEDCI